MPSHFLWPRSALILRTVQRDKDVNLACTWRLDPGLVTLAIASSLIRRGQISMNLRFLAGLVAGFVILGLSVSSAGARDDQTYGPDEITRSVSDFFGVTTEAAAKIVEHVFKDLGQPDGYIKGEEGSGAFIAGVRY